MTDQKYLGITDIAQYLGISATSAWRVIRTIPGAFAAAGSRCWRVSTSNFECWLAEREKGEVR